MTVEITVEQPKGKVQLHKLYEKPEGRTFENPPAQVKGGLSITLSQNYQSIRITTEVTLPVAANIDEIRAGQTLALQMADKEIDKAADFFAGKLADLARRAR